MEVNAINKEEVSWPLSPMAQYFSSPVITLTVLGVLESEVPIDDSLAPSMLQNVFLPVNSRFSSIMVDGQKGVKMWKKVVVNVKDHINIPDFPPNMSLEMYDRCFEEYVEKISQEPFQQDRPLWELHLVKYPTSNAAGSVIFKLHHALGDGFSLVSALVSCLQRADDPSLPLTLPTIRMRSNGHYNTKNAFKKVPKIFSLVFNTISNFCKDMLMSTIMEDDRTPIRSGVGYVGFRRTTLLTMTFSLDQIKQIKAKLGATVNDVITGAIFLGARLYMKEMCHESRNSRSTALVLLNTRMTRSYMSIDDMMKPNTEAPWGNLFAFLPVPIPKLSDAKLDDPLKFVTEAGQIIKRKRNPFAIRMTSWVLDFVNKLRGSEAVSKLLYSKLMNSSMSITNVVGPQEQMALWGNPIKGIYFMFLGAPEDVVFGVISYMGKLRVTMGVEKEFIDAEKLKSSIENAVDVIFKAATRN